MGSLVGLFGEKTSKGQDLVHLNRLFQRVGQVNAQPLATGKVIAGLVQLEAQLHMGHGVGGHHQLEAVEAG